MQTTSHFIGISLDSRILARVFIALQNTLKKYQLQEYIIVQNPLSPHITLYYLPENISDEMVRQIQDILCDIRLSEDIFAGSIGYFGEENYKHTLYISPQTLLPLSKYRDTFELLIQSNSIYENGLDFVPHITLAKILDGSIFEKYKSEIEASISHEILAIQESNISLGKIGLYGVNSTFEPELQVLL